MWIIVLSTLLVAFVSGISIGVFIERGLWETALDRARSRIEAHRDAADRRRRFRVIDGGAPDDTRLTIKPRRGSFIEQPASVWRSAA